MELQQLKPDGAEGGDPGAPAGGENPADRVLRFTNAFKDKVLPLSGGDRNPTGKRDWSSALDLVNEAFEAIRMAEERAIAAEDYHQQLIQHHKEQIKGLEQRLSATEKRAEVAESRSKEADAWLARFHDTIVDGFQRTFVSK